MRQRLRALVRLVMAVGHIGHGLWLVTRRFDAATPAERHQHVQWWAAKMLRVLGVRLQSVGEPAAGPCLLVANHISWLDIVAVHAVCPRARFVSKAEIGRWPVVGRLTAAVDTLFIERERKRDAMRVVHHVAEALRAGDTVAVFPEGTTSDGHGVLPFHANLLQAAIVTGVPVQPVAIRFFDPHHAVSPAAAYVGDTSLVRSLWWVVRARGLTVRLQLLALQPAAAADRRELAQSLRSVIQTARDPGRPG